jgi:peptidoglycan/xylan/chitin deacetylase (PgdA/CDA1 family)
MLRSGRQRSWVDDRLFAELDRTHTPATIFLTGLWTETYAGRVRRMAADPLYELENHSMDHAGWERPCYGLASVPSDAAKRSELTAAAAIIQRVAGVRPRYFRFPGGCSNAADRRMVASLGERPVAWDVVSGDPFNPRTAAIVRAVLDGVRPGSIIVAHCIGAPNAPATAAAMAQIIPDLRARGYRFVTLRELLARAG